MKVGFKLGFGFYFGYKIAKVVDHTIIKMVKDYSGQN